MITLSFIVLALFPIVAPSVLALIGLVLLCCAPSVTVRESFEQENADVLELGLAMVESVLRLDRPCMLPSEPCPDTLRSPTMADAVFAGLAITRRDYNVAAILALAG